MGVVPRKLSPVADGVVVVQLGRPPGRGRLAVEQRVEGHLGGDDVEALVPQGLLLVLGGLRPRLGQKFCHLREGRGGGPAAAGARPHVVAVPPADDEVGVVSEARRVAGGEHDVEGQKRARLRFRG